MTIKALRKMTFIKDEYSSNIKRVYTCKKCKTEIEQTEKTGVLSFFPIKRKDIVKNRGLYSSLISNKNESAWKTFASYFQGPKCTLMIDFLHHYLNTNAQIVVCQKCKNQTTLKSAKFQNFPASIFASLPSDKNQSFELQQEIRIDSNFAEISSNSHNVSFNLSKPIIVTYHLKTFLIKADQTESMSPYPLKTYFKRKNKWFCCLDSRITEVLDIQEVLVKSIDQIIFVFFKREERITSLSFLRCRSSTKSTLRIPFVYLYKYCNFDVKFDSPVYGSFCSHQKIKPLIVYTEAQNRPKIDIRKHQIQAKLVDAKVKMMLNFLKNCDASSECLTYNIFSVPISLIDFKQLTSRLDISMIDFKQTCKICAHKKHITVVHRILEKCIFYELYNEHLLQNEECVLIDKNWFDNYIGHLTSDLKDFSLSMRITQEINRSEYFINASALLKIPDDQDNNLNHLSIVETNFVKVSFKMWTFLTSLFPNETFLTFDGKSIKTEKTPLINKQESLGEDIEFLLEIILHDTEKCVNDSRVLNELIAFNTSVNIFFELLLNEKKVDKFGINQTNNAKENNSQLMYKFQKFKFLNSLDELKFQPCKLARQVLLKKRTFIIDMSQIPKKSGFQDYQHLKLGFKSKGKGILNQPNPRDTIDMQNFGSKVYGRGDSLICGPKEVKQLQSPSEKSNKDVPSESDVSHKLKEKQLINVTAKFEHCIESIVFKSHKIDDESRQNKANDSLSKSLSSNAFTQSDSIYRVIEDKCNQNKLKSQMSLKKNATPLKKSAQNCLPNNDQTNTSVQIDILYEQLVFNAIEIVAQNENDPKDQILVKFIPKNSDSIDFDELYQYLSQKAIEVYQNELVKKELINQEQSFSIKTATEVPNYSYNNSEDGISKVLNKKNSSLVNTSQGNSFFFDSIFATECKNKIEKSKKKFITGKNSLISRKNLSLILKNASNEMEYRHSVLQTSMCVKKEKDSLLFFSPKKSDSSQKQVFITDFKKKNLSKSFSSNSKKDSLNFKTEEN